MYLNRYARYSPRCSQCFLQVSWNDENTAVDFAPLIEANPLAVECLNTAKSRIDLSESELSSGAFPSSMRLVNFYHWLYAYLTAFINFAVYTYEVFLCSCIFLWHSSTSFLISLKFSLTSPSCLILARSAVFFCIAYPCERLVSEDLFGLKSTEILLDIIKSGNSLIIT